MTVFLFLSAIYWFLKYTGPFPLARKYVQDWPKESQVYGGPEWASKEEEIESYPEQFEIDPKSPWCAHRNPFGKRATLEGGYSASAAGRCGRIFWSRRNR